MGGNVLLTMHLFLSFLVPCRVHLVLGGFLSAHSVLVSLCGNFFKFGCAARIFCHGEPFGFSASEGVGGLTLAASDVFQVAASVLGQAGLLAVVCAPCGRSLRLMGCFCCGTHSNFLCGGRCIELLRSV